MAETLKAHDVRLTEPDRSKLVLRPMSEADWDLLFAWNNDPEVLYFSEGDDVTSRSIEEVQEIYRGVSRHAYNFIAELDGTPIGDCWLQEMNLPRILRRYPAALDLRRIDLLIGDKNMWGKGLGTRMIRLLVRFGFESCGADAIFGCDVADYNPRSRRAFEKNGFVVDRAVRQRPGRKAAECYDLVISRARYDRLFGTPGAGPGGKRGAQE
jgi:RimJ/RimL family protein N-acetyltransferase